MELKTDQRARMPDIRVVDSSAGLSNDSMSLKGSPVWQALSDALGHHEEGVENSANMNHAIWLAPWEEPAGEDVSRIRQKPRYYAGRSDGVLEIRLGPGGGYLTGRHLSVVGFAVVLGTSLALTRRWWLTRKVPAG